MKHGEISSNTQNTILKAACKIILDKGVEALTLDTVAREACLSKGGLLYHFPSKKKLIEGMIKYLIDGMESSLEREMQKNGGNFLLAYVQVSINNNVEQNRISSALFAAIASDPELIKPVELCYKEWQNRAAASAPSPEIGTLVRLAMDGLWISDLLNLEPPSIEMRNKLVDIILSIINNSEKLN
jgi:AcrR family transcriptional regulator